MKSVINRNAWLVSWHVDLVWCGTLSAFIFCSSLLPSVSEYSSLHGTHAQKWFITLPALPNDAQYINLQYKSQNRHGIILRIPFHGEAWQIWLLLSALESASRNASADAALRRRAMCVSFWGRLSRTQTHVAQICILRSNRNTECCCSPVPMCT